MPELDHDAEMRVLLEVAREVRGGKWLRGAPSHVLAEVMTELEKRGWNLVPAAMLQEREDYLRALTQLARHTHGSTASAMDLALVAREAVAGDADASAELERAKTAEQGLREIAAAEPKRDVDPDGVAYTIQPDYRGMAREVLERIGAKQ